jgi:hypothetical protein
MAAHTTHLMRQTSLIAYTDIQNDNTQLSQKQIIYNTIKLYADGLTRNEISYFTGIRINAVCGRVKELLDEMPPKIVEFTQRLDRNSGKKNLVVIAV